MEMTIDFLLSEQEKRGIKSRQIIRSIRNQPICETASNINHLRKLLADTHSEYKMIVLPKGEYIIDEPIKVQTGNVALVGNQTVLLASGIKTLLQLSNADAVTIQNITFKGESPYKIEATAIGAVNCRDLFVDNCKIEDFGRAGIELGQCYPAVIVETIIRRSYMIDTRDLNLDFTTLKNMGYGIGLNNSSVFVARCIFEEVKHAIAGNSTYGTGSCNYTFIDNLVRTCKIPPEIAKIDTKMGAGIDTHEGLYGTYNIMRNIVMDSHVGIHVRGGVGVIAHNYIEDCDVGIRIGKCKGYDTVYHEQYVELNDNVFVRIDPNARIIYPTIQV